MVRNKDGDFVSRAEGSDDWVRYELNWEQHMDSDHVGLRLIVEVGQHEEKKIEPIIQRQDRIKRNQPQAERYTELLEPKVARWLEKRDEKQEGTPVYVARRIRDLERIVSETQREVTQTREVRDRKDLRRKKRSGRVQETDRLRRAAIHAARTEQGTEWEEYRKSTRELRKESVEEEVEQIDRTAEKATKGLAENRQQAVWMLKRRLEASRTKVPRVIFNRHEVMLWQQEEVLEQVRVSASDICAPREVHLLAAVDSSYEREIERKHARLLKLYKEQEEEIERCRDRGERSEFEWIPTDEDHKNFNKYLKKSAAKGGAPGGTGAEAIGFTLGQRKMKEALKITLCMIARCRNTPQHWDELLIVLAHKTGRPKQQLEKAYRPIGLGEVLMKATENAIRIRCEALALAAPLHPAVMAYRAKMSVGMAHFVIETAVNFARWSGRRVVLIITDIKNAFNGAWRKMIEVREWEDIGLKGVL